MDSSLQQMILRISYKKKQQTITTEVAYNMAIVLRSLRAVNVAYYGVEGKSAALVIDLFDIAHTLAVEISGI